MSTRWLSEKIGEEHFELLNLDHREVENEIIEDMDSGFAVYYDRRWETTGVLSRWLAENLSLFQNKRVLVLGAGVGEETLILGRFASEIFINDLSSTALRLCTEQLEYNKITGSVSLLGSYQEIDLPQVDLVVASFLVYNKDTLAAMEAYLSEHQGQLLLVNERLAPFKKLLKMQAHKIVFEKDDAVCVLFS